MFVSCTYNLHHAFDPAAVIDAIRRERVTHIVLVPSQIIAVLNHPAFDPTKLDTLQMILSVGAPVMMPGYYKRPDLTREAIVDGWLRTGDAGYVDTDGFLFLVDRIKDMIVSGGVNVYPKDIEEVLVRHPEVTEAAVFGVPDEKWGETPIAAVLLSDGATMQAQDLVTWTNERVAAKFQRLAGLVILGEFPRNVAGKTLKREIRKRYLENEE